MQHRNDLLLTPSQEEQADKHSMHFVCNINDRVLYFDREIVRYYYFPPIFHMGKENI